MTHDWIMMFDEPNSCNRRQPNNKRAYQEPTPNLPDQNVYAEIDKTREKKEKKTTKDDGAGYYNLNAIDPSTARTARNEVYYDFTIPKKPSQFAVKVTDFIDYVDERKHQNDAFGPEFRGSFEVKHYIAAQGPLQETLEDFWRMIWQEDVGKITMLTKLSEGRKVKCAQYWPEAGEPMEMGEITVKLIDTETFADFEIRTISVTKGKDNRNVIQYHFTSWPDKGIPTYASSLVHFRAKVLNTHSPRSGPILVHCSAGIGRTGTFIALDFLLQQAKDTGCDVFTCVEMLRRQRVNMVQTQEQYMFVHVALLEALMTPSSAIGASDFPQHYRELLEYDGDTKILKLENEFNTLNRTSPEIDDADFSQGKSSSRRKKNRYSNIIPVNGEMPIITPSSSEDQYINAVYLPAYREKNNFIITQMPLTNTIMDFWRLIHHQKVSTIVMLNTLDTKDENDLGVYWPTGNGSETFGDFKVDIVNTSVDEDGDMEIVNLSYTYKEQEPRTVRLFKAIFWPEDMTTPSSIRAFLKLIDTANLHHQRTKSTPIIVHCINGCEKSGLYCVLQVVLERLKLDQDVGIQQIIKQMRSRRPQIIPNFEQFQFCHDVVIEFMKQYDAYSNFQ
ncbi:hypothetical protein FSP39_017709 [Pinctada imbricata]|uniref:protein-tyrosine-phosphatase n=1 Tax=Pinctada imbricata TaxID=66713 RepID=A0AA88XSZ5_PINIB|nr:hypothetical protein FSP39_017709 [Pinctada imbricata]